MGPVCSPHLFHHLIASIFLPPEGITRFTTYSNTYSFTMINFEQLRTPYPKIWQHYTELQNAYSWKMWHTSLCRSPLYHWSPLSEIKCSSVNKWSSPIMCEVSSPKFEISRKIRDEKNAYSRRVFKWNILQLNQQLYGIVKRSFTCKKIYRLSFLRIKAG